MKMLLKTALLIMAVGLGIGLFLVTIGLAVTPLLLLAKYLGI